MKEKNKLIISIIAVAMITALVIGATYAYWSWSTNTAQQTSVSFTVDSGLVANLQGGGTTTVKNLAPAACNNANYAMKVPMTLTYSNNTTEPATVKATLTVSNWNQPHTGTLALNKLHYAVTAGSAGGDNCNAGTNRTLITGGASSTFVTSGALFTDVVLESNIAAGTTNGTKSLWLWVWLDSSYAGSNTGNVISDPMQDLTFKLTWSGTMTNAS